MLLLSRRRPKGGKVWQRPKAADERRESNEGYPANWVGGRRGADRPTPSHARRPAAAMAARRDKASNT
jgi:hypothetical protein